MRVYVITQGNYSDYHICGVTLDIKEHALKIGRDLVAEYKAREEGIAT